MFKGIVNSLVYEKFNDYFDEFPAVIEAILDKAILAAKARFTARDARMRIRKSSEGAGLPGKLATVLKKIQLCVKFSLLREIQLVVVLNRKRPSNTSYFTLVGKDAQR